MRKKRFHLYHHQCHHWIQSPHPWPQCPSPPTQQLSIGGPIQQQCPSPPTSATQHPFCSPPTTAPQQWCCSPPPNSSVALTTLSSNVPLPPPNISAGLLPPLPPNKQWYKVDAQSDPRVTVMVANLLLFLSPTPMRMFFFSDSGKRHVHVHVITYYYCPLIVYYYCILYYRSLVSGGDIAGVWYTAG